MSHQKKKKARAPSWWLGGAPMPETFVGTSMYNRYPSARRPLSGCPDALTTRILARDRRAFSPLARRSSSERKVVRSSNPSVDRSTRRRRVLLDRYDDVRASRLETFDRSSYAEVHTARLRSKTGTNFAVTNYETINRRALNVQPTS